jgi:hypothetical protein
MYSQYENPCVSTQRKLNDKTNECLSFSVYTGGGRNNVCSKCLPWTGRVAWCSRSYWIDRTHWFCWTYGTYRICNKYWPDWTCGWNDTGSYGGYWSYWSSGAKFDCIWTYWTNRSYWIPWISNKHRSYWTPVNCHRAHGCNGSSWNSCEYGRNWKHGSSRPNGIKWFDRSRR